MHNYRQDWAIEAQTAGIKFSHRLKIRFFTPQGRLVALIHLKLGMAHRRVSAWLWKNITSIAAGLGIRPPKCKKFPLFGKESPRVGKPLDRFLKAHTVIVQKCFKFDVICFTGYVVNDEKPRIGHLGQIFPCTRWRGSPWNWVSVQGSEETRMMWLPDGQKNFKIGLAVLIQYRRVTDSHPRRRCKYALCISASRSKTMFWIEKRLSHF